MDDILLYATQRPPRADETYLHYEPAFDRWRWYGAASPYSGHRNCINTDVDPYDVALARERGVLCVGEKSATVPMHTGTPARPDYLNQYEMTRDHYHAALSDFAYWHTAHPTTRDTLQSQAYARAVVLDRQVQRYFVAAVKSGLASVWSLPHHYALALGLVRTYG